MRWSTPCLIVGIALAACKRDAPSGASPSASASSASVALSASAAAPSAASPATTISAPSTAAPKPIVPSKDRPRRSGAPGSTRGTVSCDGKRCQAGAEVCVWDNDATAWACVLSSSTLANGERYACDDGSDCPAGQTCCRTTAKIDEEVCMARGDVPRRCIFEVCEKSGAKCPLGQWCNLSTCEATRKGPTCSDGKRCGPREFCLFSSFDHMRCASAEDARSDTIMAQESGVTGVFECTRPDDCGAGMQCCTNQPLPWQRHTYCSVSCDIPDVVCTIDSDCGLDGTEKGALCKDGKESLPKGIGICTL